MIKKYLHCLWAVLLIVGLFGCTETPRKPRIGVSLGVGSAARWQREQAFMIERAHELGADIEVRLNQTDTPKTQNEDCIEMIASGIDVLILTPRSVRTTDEILTYARQKNVKVISYARAAMGGAVDLFIGYDCYKIGQSLGQHIAEKMYRGDLIMLKGDKSDFNTPLLYYGAMKSLKPLITSGGIRMVLDAHVTGWNPEEAQRLVKEAVSANGNHIDAIFAPNDLIAQASVEALKELRITTPVLIVGMDAELAAVKRIVAGTQDATVYMDLKLLAYSAVDEAYNMATKKKISINSAVDNDSSHKIDAYLINGKIVTRENLDKVLIEPGVYTREQIYGE